MLVDRGKDNKRRGGRRKEGGGREMEEQGRGLHAAAGPKSANVSV